MLCMRNYNSINLLNMNVLIKVMRLLGKIGLIAI